MRVAHLGIFELLFNVVDEAAAHLADEAAEEELWSHFTSPSNSSADAHQRPDLVCAKITNARYQGEMVKGYMELSRLQIG